jgi:hypothetical protein
MHASTRALPGIVDTRALLPPGGPGRDEDTPMRASGTTDSDSADGLADDSDGLPDDSDGLADDSDGLAYGGGRLGWLGGGRPRHPAPGLAEDPADDTAPAPPLLANPR